MGEQISNSDARPSLEILQGDNLEILRGLPDASFQLIYVDPPFNTGRKQKLERKRTRRTESDEEGDRTGFGGRRYTTEGESVRSYDDAYDDYDEIDDSYPVDRLTQGAVGDAETLLRRALDLDFPGFRVLWVSILVS